MADVEKTESGVSAFEDMLTPTLNDLFIDYQRLRLLQAEMLDKNPALLRLVRLLDKPLEPKDTANTVIPQVWKSY